MKPRNLLSKASVAIAAMLMWGGAAYAQQLNPAIYGPRVNTMPHGKAEYVPNQVIVKFKDTSGVQIKSTSTKKLKTSSVKRVDQKLAQLGITMAEPLMPLTGAKKLRKSSVTLKSLSGREIEEPDMSRLYIMNVDSAKDLSVHDVIKQLETVAEVEYAEPNYYVYTMATETSDIYTAEPLYGEQWGLNAINMPALWDVTTITDKRPVIAIIDTGVDTSHPDLVDNLWVNLAEAEGEDYVDDDGNGYIDDVYGYDVLRNRGASDDPNGHGTHCAGIAAAVGNNGIGIAGTNPDALIMSVRAFNVDGVGTTADIIKGIDYAAANGADVISMSFGGGPDYSISEYDACRKAFQTAVLVASAGNNGKYIDDLNWQQPGRIFPAAYDVVIGVQASDAYGKRASFSNYDHDGEYYTNYDVHGVDFFNYEVYAPGVNIMSTYPGGKYKALNGTSMAAPFVAGVVSRLLQTKERERYNGTLVGDIVHACSKATGVIDAYKAHQFNDSNRELELVIQSIEISDADAGDNDGYPESGEIIDLYPTVRCIWGNASDVKLSVEIDPEWDKDSAIEAIANNVDLGYVLNSQGSAKSKNPIRIKLNENFPNNHNLRLIVTLKVGDYEQKKQLEFIVKRASALKGVMAEDMTLTPDKEYIVDRFAVPDGVTLTILPGTVLKFSDGSEMVVGGNLVCDGTPENPIIFTMAGATDLLGDYAISLGGNEISYVIFDGFRKVSAGCIIYESILKNCIIRDVELKTFMMVSDVELIQCNIYNNNISYSGGITINDVSHTNIINNKGLAPQYHSSISLNTMNNETKYSDHSFAKTYRSRNLNVNTDEIGSYTPEFPHYFGTSVESTARIGIWDLKNPIQSYGWLTYDLSNMLTRPNAEAHGIVWKVVVNGYDAQDEFDMLPPLGVGKNKFEVYFNRPMNKAVMPTVAMGAVEPYNQIAIAEDGSWNEDGTIYTVYLTIDGKLGADGLNRIYVADAEDNEHFELITEDFRFNVNVQAAGTLSTGLMAEAGLGKVTLTWETDEEDFEDLLGYNIHRYTMINDSVASDTITINETLIDSREQMFIDYNVLPGTTYYYQIKQLTTSLNSHDLSNVVAATPLTAQKGDANGSMSVDVADVVTEVAYMTGQDPQPFIFEAADVNTDQVVNVLDVVGTVNIIKTPSGVATMSVNNSAVYTIENGILYVESPVALGGVQFRLNMADGTEITPLEVLDGFETVGDNQGENGYLFFAFSMSGKTIPTGKHALLRIGDAAITEVVLCDATGRSIVGIDGDTSGIGAVAAMQMELPYPNPFYDVLTVPYKVGKDGLHDVKIVVSTITGATVAVHSAEAEYGHHTWTWESGNIGEGIYFVSLYVDGKLMQTAKAVKRR